MGTSSRIATILDSAMLINNGVNIHPPGTPLSGLTPVSNLSGELGGRYLLRYMLPYQVGRMIGGIGAPQHVTPTAYSPEETNSWLALPAPASPRSYVLLLNPSRLTNVVGPPLGTLRWGNRVYFT